MKKVLLKSGGDGGLARGGETGQPDGETALTAGLIALLARQRRVPGNVAVEAIVSW